MLLSHFNFFREIHLNSPRNGDFHVIFGAFWDRNPRPFRGSPQVPRTAPVACWAAGWAALENVSVARLRLRWGFGRDCNQWDWIYLLGLIPFHDSFIYHSTHYHTILDTTMIPIVVGICW